MIRFWIVLERTKLKPKLNLREKLWKGLGSPVIDVTVKKDSLLVYVFHFFGILAGRCGSVAVRERDKDRKDTGSRSRLDPMLPFCFFFIETLSITGQKFSICIKNGSDRLRKRQLWRLPIRVTPWRFSFSSLVSHENTDTTMVKKTI